MAVVVDGGAMDLTSQWPKRDLAMAAGVNLLAMGITIPGLSQEY